MKTNFFTIALVLLFCHQLIGQKKRIRDHGIEIGVLKPGTLNDITDVPGVTVGHFTKIQGEDIRTGVTAILPHDGNIFQEKVPAAIFLANGFGKLAGYSQVKELGCLETPIVLTNTLSVPTASKALIRYTLDQSENATVRSVNPVVGETNDGRLNAIRKMSITESEVIRAIENAGEGPVREGNVGAGTGTVCFGFKGGIGSSSRKIPEKQGGYTVGVLVQSNFGGVLTIKGAEVDKELDRVSSNFKYDADGSCMIVVMTDAPIDARNLERLAKRAFMGLARTGGIASNGSGDYVIAVSTAEELRIPYNSDSRFNEGKTLRNDAMTPLFLAAIEATEEAIFNSLFAAETMEGKNGAKVEALPIDQVVKLLNK